MSTDNKMEEKADTKKRDERTYLKNRQSQIVNGNNKKKDCERMDGSLKGKDNGKMMKRTLMAG